MTPDELMEHMLATDPPPVGKPARARASTELERIVVTTADGRVFDLGRPGKHRLGPTALRFRARVLRYRLQRRKG